jgi:hypothetical protein
MVGLDAGDSYQISAAAVRQGLMHENRALNLLGIYAVDKTGPLASPAP